MGINKNINTYFFLIYIILKIKYFLPAMTLIYVPISNGRLQRILGLMYLVITIMIICYLYASYIKIVGKYS